jgi:DNA-binding response OmpR family regulator
MIVDDEERVRNLLLEYLSDFDEFSLFEAASGEQALELLRGRPADLCVVDMRLPGMNGVSFIQASSEAGLCRKFLVHTGSVDFTLTPELASLGLGEADIFTKPANAKDILLRIRAVT